MNKPDWWPKNPYPESIFPMNVDEYVAAIPDAQLRTDISGSLGRYFWDLASNEIFKAWQSHKENLQKRGGCR